MSESNQKPRIVLGLIKVRRSWRYRRLLRVFVDLWSKRFYGLILPTVPAGIGLRVIAREVVPSHWRRFVELPGWRLGLFTEWSFAPFKVDSSLGYFLTHLNRLRPFTLVSLLIGTICG